MKKTWAKILVTTSLTTAAVLLVWPMVRSHRQAFVSAKVFSRGVALTVAPQPAAKIPHSQLADRSTPPISPNGSTRSTGLDDELRHLEQEIRRAEQIENADERQRALVDACTRWSKYDPAEAISWMRKLGLNQVSSTAAIEQIVQTWANTDFEAALVWTERETDGEQQELMLERLAFIRAQNQPLSAARLVEEQIPAGSIQIEATLSVLHQWALSDFGGATAWVDRFPSGLQSRARAELDGIARYRLAQH